MTEDRIAVAQREQTELYRLLVENVRDYAMFLLDPAGTVVSWNRGAERIKGYAASEVIGKHFSIFYPPQDVRHGKTEYALRVAADVGSWEDEGWRVRKDGSRFWANVLITALYDDDDTLVGFAKVTRDLTQRKRAEEERIRLLEMEQQARAQSEAALDNLRAIQIVTEAALAHLTLGDLLRELMDRVSEILQVDTVAVLLVEQEEGREVLVARASKGIQEEVERGVRIPVGEGFAGRIASERQPIVLDTVERGDVLNPILLEKRIRSLLGVPLIIEGRVLGVLHVGSLHQRNFGDSDVQLLQIVADRISLAIDHARLFEAARFARQEAEVAEAMVQARDEFLSVAAHELKTPLTGLRLAVQTLQRRLQRGTLMDEAGLARSLRTVDRQIDRLSRLVTQLLDTVRADAGRLELDRSRTDLAELVGEVCGQIRAHTDRHQIVVCSPEPVWARVDPLRIEQVIMNLLDNAVKYSPDGGAIEVDVNAPQPGWACIVIRDHGLGVPSEHRPHLFERFYQAHGNDYRSGLGLGLYISQEIAEMHGGRIEAQFPPDGGTRFVLELPLEQQQ